MLGEREAEAEREAASVVVLVPEPRAEAEEQREGDCVAHGERVRLPLLEKEAVGEVETEALGQGLKEAVAQAEWVMETVAEREGERLSEAVRDGVREGEGEAVAERQRESVLGGLEAVKGGEKLRDSVMETVVEMLRVEVTQSEGDRESEALGVRVGWEAEGEKEGLAEGVIVCETSIRIRASAREPWSTIYRRPEESVVRPPRPLPVDPNLTLSHGTVLHDVVVQLPASTRVPELSSRPATRVTTPERVILLITEEDKDSCIMSPA